MGYRKTRFAKRRRIQKEKWVRNRLRKDKVQAARARKAPAKAGAKG